MQANTKWRCSYIVWCQIWRLTSRLHNLPPDHWTCSFVCHFNSIESIQPCCYFGALNLSYTLAYMSYHAGTNIHFSQVIDVKVKCLAKGTQTLKQCRLNAERREINIIFLWKPAPSVYWTLVTGSGNCKAPRSSHCATSLSLSESTASITEAGCNLNNATYFLWGCVLTFWYFFLQKILLLKADIAPGCQNIQYKMSDDSLTIWLCCYDAKYAYILCRLLN